GPLDAFVDLQDRAAVCSLIVDILAIARGERYAVSESMTTTVDGQRLDVEVRMFAPSEGENGDHVIVAIVDLTERKRLERELENKGALLQALTDAVPDIVFMKDLEGRFIFSNRAHAAAAGAAHPSRVVGRTDGDFCPPDVAAKQRGDDMRVISSGEAMTNFEEKISTEEGTRWVLTTKVPVRSPEGALLGVAGIVRDITAIRVLSHELEDERKLLLTTINGIPDNVFVKDRQSRYVLTNQAQADSVGAASPQEMVGKRDSDYVTPELAEKYAADDRVVMETGEGQINMEEVSLREGGAKRWVLTTKVPLRDEAGNVTGLVGISRDITERKLFETRMQHAQKLESLGVLAGGIAHDFNNVLMTIIGNADIARAVVSPGSPVSDHLQEIARAAQRASGLCRQMLAFSGKGKFQVQPVDLSAVIEEMKGMLFMSASRKAMLSYTLAPDLPAIRADVSQLNQVVMNLVINASEAIGDASGSIIIETRAIDCDQDYLNAVMSGEGLPAGRYVTLEVSDTGCGMDETTRARIFEPFFTTKFTGRGLGLAAVMGIVRGHQGAIKVYSEVGKGTTFKVYFPAVVEEAHPLAALPSGTPTWRGHGTVLLVDDDEGIRTVGRMMLERLGFQVTTAGDGREALDILATRGEGIVCVILDLTMPRMDGKEAFLEIKRLSPEMSVVVTSGYNEQSAIQEFVGLGLAGFIQKPYRLNEIEEKLRQILGDD
ncbi:MAG TPA: PAS domain-containing protein, partial [Spirochaetia bacterium]